MQQRILYFPTEMLSIIRKRYQDVPEEINIIATLYENTMIDLNTILVATRKRYDDLADKYDITGATKSEKKLLDDTFRLGKHFEKKKTELLVEISKITNTVKPIIPYLPRDWNSKCVPRKVHY